MAPIWSTFTLLTELVVTAAVLTTVYRGYYAGVFLSWVALPTLAYEALFNITYMATRLAHNDPALGLASPLYLALAAFHGIFSLLMFIALVVFFIVAWRRYKGGENYFAMHSRLTLAFVICWLISICSGVVFYIVSYVV